MGCCPSLNSETVKDDDDHQVLQSNSNPQASTAPQVSGDDLGEIRRFFPNFCQEALDRFGGNNPQPSPPKQSFESGYETGSPKGDSGSQTKNLDDNPSSSQAANSEVDLAGPSNLARGRQFLFDDLCKATGGFKIENRLGSGCFGDVYKGCLEDTDETVAIKTLDPSGGQGKEEFDAECMLFGANHENILKLIGTCEEKGQMILVFEYVPFGSLKEKLLDEKSFLDWNSRMKIALGIARGVEYLHVHKKMIHRDLKSANILLGPEFQPKIADFGLAIEGPKEGETFIVMPCVGTHGYYDREYSDSGRVSYASDVYSLGVVILELITGRLAVDENRSLSESALALWAKELMEQKKFDEMIDPKLIDPPASALRALSIARKCIKSIPAERPDIGHLVQILTKSFQT